MDDPRYIIGKIRKSLDELEELIQSGSEASIPRKKSGLFDGNSYSGVAGGLRRLLSEGFFKQPRIVEVVDMELRKHGYIYRRDVISVALLRLTRPPKVILTRLASDANKKKWEYVQRK